jgi:hypothetical protein
MTLVQEEPVRVNRRRRGRWVGLWVVLLILVGLVVAADRIGEKVAEQRLVAAVTDQAEARGVTADSTDVTIGGFPFLTQVLRGKYDQITIDMRQARSGDLRVEQLLVNAYGVEADTAKLINGQPEATADRVTGTAVIDWDDLPKLLDYAGVGVGDAKFAAAGEGVRIRATARLAGQSLPLAATAKFTVKDGKLSVKVSDAEIEGVRLNPTLQSALDSLQRRMSIPVDVPPLPFGLKLDEVRAQEEGLAVTATARNVPIAQ